MTLAAQVAPPAPTTPVRWSEVDDAFWVAHREGDYAGCVDGADGIFATYDAYGTLVARSDSLEDARLMLRRTEHPSYWTRRRVKKSLPFAAATATGAAAASILIAAGMLAPVL